MLKAVSNGMPDARSPECANGSVHEVRRLRCLPFAPAREYPWPILGEFGIKEEVPSKWTGLRPAVTRRLIDAWGARWSAHDADGLIALFTEDLTYEDKALGRIHSGPAELRAFVEETVGGFPDVTFEMRSTFATDTHGGAEWVMRGTHTGDLPGLPATGRAFEIQGASILEFAGDRIRRCTDYWDQVPFLKQLGVLPG